MTNENTWSVLEDQMGRPTIEDFRERTEQITGIDFEGSEPRFLTWKDWKNLVHFLETEVGDSADTSETEVDRRLDRFTNTSETVDGDTE